MFQMRLLFACFILALLFASEADAQANACAATDTTNIMNPKILSAVLTAHTTVNPNQQAITTGYTIQALQGTTVVSTIDLPKTAFTLLPGTPAACYQVAIPAFTNVQNNILYKIGLIANGLAGNSPVGVTAQSFFLQGVSPEPTNLRLAVSRMLSKLWDSILSTTHSKPWFQPIGR